MVPRIRNCVIAQCGNHPQAERRPSLPLFPAWCCPRCTAGCCVALRDRIKRLRAHRRPCRVSRPAKVHSLHPRWTGRRVSLIPVLSTKQSWFRSYWRCSRRVDRINRGSVSRRPQTGYEAPTNALGCRKKFNIAEIRNEQGRLPPVRTKYPKPSLYYCNQNMRAETYPPFVARISPCRRGVIRSTSLTATASSADGPRC
jgi:hypothetical protein